MKIFQIFRKINLSRTKDVKQESRVRNILILPKDDKTKIDDNLRKIIYDVIEKYKLLDLLVGYKEYFIKVSTQTGEGFSIAEIYNLWNENHFFKVETPFNLPRQNGNPICPKNIIFVQVECINLYTPNMGSFWGFNGYVLNILIDIELGKILDARGERAI